jgi:hypothetical protein
MLVPWSRKIATWESFFLFFLKELGRAIAIGDLAGSFLRGGLW